jgi:hypothetical protein
MTLLASERWKCWNHNGTVIVTGNAGITVLLLHLLQVKGAGSSKTNAC